MSSTVMPRAQARRLLHVMGASAAAIAAGLAVPAYAQCTPNPTASGTTTTCTETEAEGLTVGATSIYDQPPRIVVLAGAEVHAGPGDPGAITILEQVGEFYLPSLSNSGAVRSTTGAAIASLGDPGRAGITILENAEGAVIAGATGGVTVPVRQFQNRGLIDGGTGSAYAYSQSPGGGLIVFPTFLNNSGTITSNSATATIGGYSLPSITNTGRIENLGSGLAIDASSSPMLAVSNGATGVIATAGPVAIIGSTQLNLSNAGVITGSVIGGNGGNYGDFADRIYNADGVINGSVLLDGGNDHLLARLGENGTVEGITGVIDGGAGTDLLEFSVREDRMLSAIPTLPIGFETFQFDIVNDATLTFAAPPPAGGYAVRGTGTVVIGADMVTAGPVLTMNYTRGNVGFEELNFVNDRTITTTLSSPQDSAIRLDSIVTASNSGTIAATGGNAIDFGRSSNQTVFENSGTITATGYAVAMNGSFVNTGIVHSTDGTALINDLGGGLMRGIVSTNSGTIEGATTGAYIRMVVLENSGRIAATNGVGVELWGGALENLAGGVIEGTTFGVHTDGSFASYVANAGTINGNVDFNPPYNNSYGGSADWFFNRGGVVNGSVLMGGGDDVFVTELSAPSDGVTGTIDGGMGLDTYLYTTSVDASATMAAPLATFEATGYAVLDGAHLTLTAPAPLTNTLSLAGTGTIDLTADIAGSANPLIRIDRIPTAVLSYTTGGVLPTDLTVISRGTLLVNVPAGQAAPWGGYVVGDPGSSFENAGTIQASLSPPYNGGYGIIQGWEEVVNSGVISLEGAIGVSQSMRLINSGTIVQAGTLAAQGVSGVSEVDNSGTISVAGIAVQFGTGGELRNTGTILSTASIGVEMTYGGTVENAAGGRIAGPIGIASQGGLVINSGAIEGSVRLDYTPWGGLGTGYYSGAYVAAGGTVAGDVVFGGNSDLFLQVGESTGVSGVIDGGDSYDAFGRVYAHDATVDLGGPLGGVNFETQMIFASGADTTVTLTSATPYGETPWIGGDGRIVNQATVGSIRGYEPSPFMPPSGFDLDATLAEFRNEGTILNSFFAGNVASFVNTGQIGDGADDDDGVALYSDEYLRFENSGTILGTGGEQGVELWTLTGVGITAINSGAVTGSFSIEITADEPDDTAALDFANSGSITTTAPDTTALYLGQYYAGGTIAVDNSGTISAEGSLSDALRVELTTPDTPPIAYAIINSGTIEASGGGTTFTYGPPYFDPPFTVTTQVVAVGITGGENISGTILNTATGTISAIRESSTAVSVIGHGLDLTNAGTINGTVGQLLGEADLLAGWNGTRFLAGAVQTYGEFADVVRNSGTITGSIDLGGGDDRLENSALIEGTTYLGLGDDTLTLVAGSVIDGLVDGGEGTDAVLVLASGDGSVTGNTLIGFESLNQSGTGTIAYSGTFGLDTIGLADSNLRVDAGATLATAGTTAVTGTAGSESVTVAGTLAGAIALGDGSDRFAEIGAGRATGAVDGGGGRDLYAVTLSGDRAGVSQVSGFEELAVGGSGSLALDRSFELVSLAGTDLVMGTGAGAGAIQGSAAAERVTSASDLARVALGGGDDTLSLGATVLGGSYLGDAGGDTLVLTAADAVRLDGALSGFEQIASTSGALSVAGTLGAAGESVSLGDGAQTLTLLAGGRLLGTVDLAGGDDQLRIQGGTLGGRVEGGAGTDVATITTAGDTTLAAVLGGFEQLRSEGSGSLSLTQGAFQFDRVDAGTDLRIAADGVLTAPQVAFGARDDRLTIAGGFSGAVTGGAGSDTLTVTGGTAASPVRFASISEFEAFAMTGGYAELSGQAQLGALTMTGGQFTGLAGSTLTASNIAVSPGATFGSAGTVNAGLVIASGAVFSPGASPAVMTVNGNVSLAGGSTTLFEFVPAPGQSDQLLINGDLIIDAGAILNLTGNRPLTPGVAYDMIVANAISGQFTVGTWDRSAVQGFLRYLDGAAQDRLQLLGTFVSLDPLPGAAGAAVTYVNDLLVSGAASSALLDSVNTLLGGNGYASAQAFSLLTPEVYASAMQLGTENGLVLAKAGRSGVMDGAGERPALFTFGSGAGAWRTLDAVSVTGASGAKNNVYEVLGGIGYGNAQASLSGFAGYLDGEQRIAALGARTDADGMVAGVSGHVALGGLQLHALVAYDWSSANTSRAAPGAATVSSDYDLDSLVLDAVASYDAPLGRGLVITPAVGITHIATDRDATRESGSAAFALDVDGDSHAATFVDGAIALRGPATSSIRPWAEIGVRHQLAGELALASAGLVGTTSRFAVPGVSREQTVITYGAGFEASVAETVSLFAGYHGESGDGSGSNLTGGVRVRF